MRTTLKFGSCVIVTLMFLLGCSSQQSLQEYYIDSKENPNFISLDIPASILNLDETELNEDQKKVLRSLKKLNILAFKKTTDNVSAYSAERQKVNAILKNDKFTDLMKLNTSYGKGVVKFLGDEDAIDEVVIYGNSDDKGFALIRILGDNMNPAYLVQLLQILQKSDYKGEGLGELGKLFKE